MSTENGSILFVKGAQPIKVKGAGGLTYLAGELSSAGLRNQGDVLRQVKHFLKSTYGYSTDNTPEQNEAVPGEGTAAAALLYEDTAFAVLLADYSRKLQPVDLLQWPDGFLEDCYRTVLEINPKLDPERAAKAAGLGQAQPETHNTGSGEPVSIEDARKKA
jgi:hypothetical protein